MRLKVQNLLKHYRSAYVNNVEGWEGQGELLSKFEFGLKINDFIFSRKKFEEKVDDNATLNVEGRPNEGILFGSLSLSISLRLSLWK